MGTVRKAGAVAGGCGATAAFPFVLGDGLSLCSPPEKRLKSEEMLEGRAGQRSGGQGGGGDVCPESSPFAAARPVSHSVGEAAPDHGGNRRLEAKCDGDLRCVDVHSLQRGGSCGGGPDVSPARASLPLLRERNYLDCVAGSPVRMGCSLKQQPPQSEKEMPVLCKLESCSPPGPSQTAQCRGFEKGNERQGNEVGIALEGSVSLTIGYGCGSVGYGGRTSVEGERNFISGFGESRFSPDGHHAGGGCAAVPGSRAAPTSAAGVRGGGGESPRSSVDSQSGESCPMTGTGVVGEARGGGGGRGNLPLPGSIKAETLNVTSTGSYGQSAGRVGLTMAGRPAGAGGLLGHVAAPAAAAAACQGANVVRVGCATGTAATTVTTSVTQTASGLAHGHVQHHHLQQKPVTRGDASLPAAQQSPRQQQQQRPQAHVANSNLCVPFCSVCSMAAPLTPPAPAWKANDSKSEEERHKRAKNLLSSVESQKVIDFLSENRFKIVCTDRGGGQDGGLSERLRAVVEGQMPAAPATAMMAAKVEATQSHPHREEGLGGLRAHSQGAMAAAAAAAGGPRSPSPAARGVDEAGRRSTGDGGMAVGPPSSAMDGERDRGREMVVPTATGYCRSAESVPARSGGSMSDDRSHSEVLQSVERKSRSRTRSPPVVVLARCDEGSGAGRSERLAGSGTMTNNGNPAVTISSMIAGFLQAQGLAALTASDQHSQQQGQQQQARSLSAAKASPVPAARGSNLAKPVLPKLFKQSMSSPSPNSPTSSSNKEQQNGHGLGTLVGCISGTTERSSADGRTAVATGQSSPDCSTTTGGGAAVVDEHHQEHQCKEEAPEENPRQQQQQQQQLQKQEEERRGYREEEMRKKRCCSGHQPILMNMNACPSSTPDNEMIRRLREGGGVGGGGEGGGGGVGLSFQRPPAECDRSPEKVAVSFSVAAGAGGTGATKRQCLRIAEEDPNSRHHPYPSPLPLTVIAHEKVSGSVACPTTGSPAGCSAAETPIITSAASPAAMVGSTSVAAAAAAAAAAAPEASPASRKQRRGVGMSGGQRRTSSQPSKKKGRPSKSLLEITICSRKKNPLTGKMMVKETGAAKKKIQKIKELLWDIVEIVLGPKEVIKPADVDKALAVVLERGIGGAQARNIVKLLPERNPGSVRAMREDFLKIIRQDFTNARMAAGPVARGGLKQKTLKELKSLDTHGVLSCSWSGIYLCRKADEHNDPPFVDDEDHQADGVRTPTSKVANRFDVPVEWEEKKPERLGDAEGNIAPPLQMLGERSPPSTRMVKRPRIEQSSGCPSKEIVIGLQSPAAMGAGLPWRGDNGAHDDCLDRKGLNLNQVVHA